MHLTLSDGALLYYEVLPCTAKQDTDWIVWLNGLTQSTLSWKLTTPYFEKTHHQLLVDFIFQGQSSAAPHFRTFENHATDIFTLLEHLNISTAHIAGISYGGAVVLRMMHLYSQKIKSAILISTFAYKTPYFDAIGEMWKKALLVGGYEHLVEVILPIGLGASYFENPVIPIDVLKNNRISQQLKPENILALMQATASSERNYLPVIAQNPTKSLIIHGEEDFLCPPKFGQDLHQVLPNSKLIVIPKAGHTLNLEAVPQLAAHILSFIS
ncbi:MAG: alpha/beta hydrolase [Bacteroidia bacterium]|nr:alpha/beta hydrolase [Bacteroidia bacterium]MDW8302032.1 alpha/beta hydrolase [Bacteroidia bacterium]